MASSPHLRPQCSSCRRAVLHRHDDCAASIPKFGPEIKNRCTKEGVNGEKLASILKSGLEIKNRCAKEGVNGEKLTSILKSGLEFKNQCTQEAVNGEILASILKFGLEITNRCRKQHIPPARVHHALTTRLALEVLHGAGSTAVRQRFGSGGKSGC